MAEAKDSAKKSTRKAGRLAILAAMGPGLLTAMAGNDAGGIATYSSTGATYGYGMLWTVPLMCVLLIVAQETAARMGCATGKGFAALIREQFGVRVSAIAMLALIISNFTVTLSEFAGIASGMELFGIPLQVSVPIAGIATWLLTQSGSYHRVEKILLALSCVFLTYIVSGIISNPDWGLALKDTVIPQFSTDPGYVSLLVANIGTTISPYMLFMVSSNVVEKNLKGSDIPGQRADNVSGVVAAEITTWFIVLTTGTVLYPAGVTVNSAADAAQALVPLAGQYASALFAAGLAGASFLAACVLPGITASAVCEAFGWEHGVDRSWNEAPAYRVIITGITILSAAIVLIPNVDLFGVMMLAQVINGVLLPVLMVCMVLIASDKHVMGQYANGRVWTGLTWFTIVVVIILTIVMFVLQAMGL
ncbi:NRAMP (natural resistance-associated macrophage protein) metal ion transporters [Olsenella sp. KH3B4]|uniref:Nramp family divalent metal transporter n=1 Tax=Olsenella sp. KH3B4 TaxID=1855394 RepID=UPI0008C6C809|nr:Nramp family divalent metal transporter [Olsenella sp. KH3B4]SET12165.1 NRAMP (natural resistance-associated macrophage protein) metal ion transporters [Olsenella sp. KH3B4]